MPGAKGMLQVLGGFWELGLWGKSWGLGEQRTEVLRKCVVRQISRFLNYKRPHVGGKARRQEKGDFE